MSERYAEMSDAEIEATLAALNMKGARKVRGISRTVVAATRGVIPRNSNYTCVYFTGDGSESMTKWRSTYVEAYNGFFLQAMRESAVPGSILVANSYFTDQRYSQEWLTNAPDNEKGDFQEPMHLLHAPLPLENVPDLTEAEFDPRSWNSMTPLNDAIASQMEAGVAYTETVSKTGKSITCELVVFTDGMNNASLHISDAKQLAPDMRRLMEMQNFIPVLIGFGRTKAEAEYFTEYGLMAGFPRKNILAVAGSNDEDARRELRSIMRTVSQRTVAASAGAVDPNEFFS